MSLRVEKIVTGSYKQNCYIVAEESGDALVIDPGSDADDIIVTVNKHGWRPLAVIATHAHFDHVGVVANIMENFSIPFYLHHSDKALLRRMNLFKMVVESGPALRIPEITYDLAEMATPFSIGEFSLDIIPTPGHTPGGVCILTDGNIFTGDTILPMGVGRTDLPGGNPADLVASINKLSDLSGILVAHPGHGPSMPLGALLDMANEKGIAGMTGN